jgi:hypothetical protein
MMAEFSPFLAAPPRVVIALLFTHQSKKEVSSGCGEISCKLILPKKKNQYCLENAQDISRWSMGFSSLSQKGQFFFQVRTLARFVLTKKRV